MTDTLNPFDPTTPPAANLTERQTTNRSVADGLAEASKMIVIDANKDASGLRNFFSQSARNAYANHAFYRLDGSDDYIEYADSAHLDVVTFDFALRAVFKPDSVATANQFLMNKEAGGIGYGLEIREDDLWIRLDDNTADATALIGTAVITANVVHDVIVNFDRSGNATAYVNGVNVGTVDISGSALTLSSAGVLRIGSESGGTTKPFKGEMYDWEMWNCLIPEAQVYEMQSGGTQPFLYYGASSTNLLDEPAFATNAKWDATGKADDTGGDAEWTFAAGALGGTITQTAANRAGAGIGGKRYRFVQTVSVTTAPDGDAAYTITTGFAESAVSLDMTAVTQKAYEFTSKEAAAAGDFVLDVTETTATQGQFASDDVELYQIGQVLAVDPAGFASGFAYNTGNDTLKGTVSGATLHNTSVSGDWTGVTFVVGAAHTDTVNVAMQFTDAAGNDISYPATGIFYLADDSAGLDITATGPDGANAINADGSAVELLADKVWAFTTEADGDLAFDVKDTSGAVDWYLVVQLPNGRLAISSKIEITA